MASNAVSQSDISAVVGYLLGKGYFNTSSPNLPQNISILAEANTDNQGGLSTQPVVVTSAAQVANICGWGSPAYTIARILFPATGAGVSCPVTLYPQLAAGGSTAKVIKIVPTGTATGNGTVKLNVCGRTQLDGGNYNVNIVTGDTPNEINTKMQAAIASILGAPVIGASILGIGAATLGAGGTGYAVNDTFTVNTGTTLATGKVLTVSTGAVATFSILTPGQGYAVASGVATTHTSGSGTGLTINITTTTITASTFTTKWAGLTADGVNIAVDLNNTDLGITFAVTAPTAGSGTPAIGDGTGGTTGLDFFGNAWNTIVINSYGLEDDIMSALEAYNGIPDPVNPTGQYAGIIMRPMWALSGTVEDDPTSITNTDTRKVNVTIVPCVAPLSAGMQYEAAANVAYLIANVFQNNPESDIIGLSYPDMPPPTAGSIPSMTQYSFRDYCVKRGCSTVDYSGGASGKGIYTVIDLVTTYNKEGEFPPFFRYVRDLNVHFNYKFGYYLLQQQKAFGKTLVPDDSSATRDTIIKPRMWQADVAAYNLDCERRALIVNAKANNKQIQVTISTSNANRMDTVQPIQISAIGRILATTTIGGFFFGSN